MNMINSRSGQLPDMLRRSVRSPVFFNSNLVQSPMLAATLSAIGLLALSVQQAQACSSCGCALNSDWSSQGYAVASGLRVDVRYDYINQTQLREGAHQVARNRLTLPNEQEVQQQTLNRNTMLAVDYAPSRNWGMRVELPYVHRDHTTIAEGETDIASSQTSHLGDVRLLGRYQGFSPDLSWGMQFGLKLPTGSIKDAFRDGPIAGEQIDRGLQAGTGTTDAVLGVYHFGTASHHLGYFAQAQIQVPLNSRDEFKPGSTLNLMAGLRYTNAGIWQPQLQVNAKVESRESGASSDRDNSGSTALYLSPGLSVQAMKQLHAFVFLQVPVYQRVNGLQLLPRNIVSAGLHHGF